MYHLFSLGCVSYRRRNFYPSLHTARPPYHPCWQPLSAQSNPWFRRMISSASPAAKISGRESINQQLINMEVSPKCSLKMGLGMHRTASSCAQDGHWSRSSSL